MCISVAHNYYFSYDEKGEKKGKGGDRFLTKDQESRIHIKGVNEAFISVRTTERILDE